MNNDKKLWHFGQVNSNVLSFGLLTDSFVSFRTRYNLVFKSCCCTNISPLNSLTSLALHTVTYVHLYILN